WKIVFYPGVRIVHLEGKSFEKMTSHRRIMQYDSAKKFFRKHYSLGTLWWFEFCTILGSFIKVVYFGIRILFQPRQREKWLPHYLWNAFIFELFGRNFKVRTKGDVA
ncbi:MAG: hypothetical protein ABIC40_07935, partial [bacterium]